MFPSERGKKNNNEFPILFEGNICLQAKMILETYSVDFIFSSGFPLKDGRYAFRFRFTAFDKEEMKRPSEGCFEIKGDFNKLHN